MPEGFRNGGDVQGRDSFLVNFSTRSQYAESYRTLRTNITFAMMEKECNSLLVTSSLPGEGKTTTVVNLSYTIAQTGKKVLMIDADLRRPGMTSRFGVQKASGFSNIVVDILGCPLTKGNIADFGLRDLIRLHSLQERTCLLNIADGRNEVELTFLRGELVDAYWKNRPVARKLASVLIRAKLLTENEARVAFVHKKKSARRLGAVLLSLKMVDEKKLHKILAVQMMESLGVAVKMVKGQFVVRPVTEDEMFLSGLKAMKFSQLAGEVFSSDQVTSSYIKENIKKRILATKEDNLFLLPSGSIPPHPSELLGSSKTIYLLGWLKTKFDVIIVDSSPIVPASDALLLSQLVDGVVLVVEAGGTNRTIVKDAAQQLAKAKANIIGVLLNRADLRKGAYYSY